MAKKKVAFLGPISSYSHQAVVGYFSTSDFEYVPMVSFRDIFDAVQSGEVSRGVIPFENSTNGSVVPTLDLFADRSNLYSDTVICGEIYLDVHHYLLGSSLSTSHAGDFLKEPRISIPTFSTTDLSKPRTSPQASLKRVERIYSHPQAFGQCEIFLEAYLKRVERIDVSSTSKAAELVKADITGTSAAIASQMASDVHGLSVLAKGIEDREDNTTRFFILGKTSKSSGLDEMAKRSLEDVPQCKTFVSFTLDHTAPGALADVLECFRQYKLNLTSINSRPSRITPFQYIFFVEFQGSMLYDPGDNVKDAMNSLSKVAQTYRWLGSWVDKLI